MAINDFTKLLGVGVFHSGVEVYGSEYAYGGHLSTFTGIYDMNPKDSLVLGEDFRYKLVSEYSRSGITMILWN